MKRRLAIAVCLLAAAVPVLAQDASGTWQLSVTRTDDRERNTSMTIKKEGEKLTGTLVGPEEAQLPITGTQSGADVTIAFDITTQDGTFSVALKGRQDGDSMKGRLEIGGQDQGEWTAARSKAAER